MKTAMTLVASALSAFGATACCAGPLIMVLLGFSGATAARLQRLEQFQPIFVALTLLFVGLAFHRLYVKPRQCAAGSPCESSSVVRRQRGILWLVLASIGSLALLPAFSEYLL